MAVNPLASLLMYSIFPDPSYMALQQLDPFFPRVQTPPALHRPLTTGMSQAPPTQALGALVVCPITPLVPIRFR